MISIEVCNVSDWAQDMATNHHHHLGGDFLLFAAYFI